MDPIDPKEQSNKEDTERLLARSRELKEKAKATSEKLNELKEQAGRLNDGDSAQK